MNKKIKITYLITGLYVGGAETMLKRVVMHLNKDKYNIKIYTIIKGGKIFNELKNKGFDIQCLNLNIVILFKLRKLLKNDKPDILHCWMFHSNILGRIAGFGLGIKIISSIRTKYQGKYLFNIIDFLTQWMVNCYTTNSKSVKKFTKENGILKKIYVIQNGLEKEKFIISKVNKESLKKSISIEDNLPIIIMIANPRKQKDYPTMLKAISIVHKYKKVHLLAVGGGTQYEDETKELKKLVKSLDIDQYIHFLGYREDVKELLMISDIWASSTLYEGQSNALLEAMAMKLPIITTDIPENAEVVKNNQNALLITPKSVMELSASILKFINNKKFAKRMAKNAFKKVKKTYSLKKTIEKTEELYDKLS